MRIKVCLPVLAIAALLSGCSSFSPGSNPFATRSAREAAKTPDNKKTNETTDVSRAKKRARIGARKAAETSPVMNDAILSLSATLVAPAAPPLKPPPFPFASDIPAGTLRSSLENQFGGPHLRIGKVDRGSLIEKYLYIQPDRKATTIAQLYDGRVTAATTTVP